MYIKYKEGNNRPSSINRKPLVHKHNKVGNKCHTQDNTDTRETQVCEKVPRKSQLHLMWPRTRRAINGNINVNYKNIILNVKFAWNHWTCIMCNWACKNKKR